MNLYGILLYSCPFRSYIFHFKKLLSTLLAQRQYFDSFRRTVLTKYKKVESLYTQSKNVKSINFIFVTTYFQASAFVIMIIFHADDMVKTNEKIK